MIPVIVLMDIETEEVIGHVVFHPAGVLEYGLGVKGYPVNVLKAVQEFIKNNGMSEPLYIKHQALMSDDKIPQEILEQEAQFYAKLIAEQKPPLQIAGHLVTAEVRYIKDESQ